MNTFVLVIMLISQGQADGDMVGLMSEKDCQHTATELLSKVVSQDRNPEHQYKGYCIDVKTGIVKPTETQEEVLKNL